MFKRMLLVLLVALSTNLLAQPQPQGQEFIPGLPAEVNAQIIKSVLTLSDTQPGTVIENYKQFVRLKRINKFAWDYLNENIKTKSGETVTRYQQWLLHELTAKDFIELNNYVLQGTALARSFSKKDPTAQNILVLAELLISLNKLDPNLTWALSVKDFHDNNLYNLLQLAVKTSFVPLLNMLLESKIFSTSDTLVWAVYEGLGRGGPIYTNVLKELLKQKVNPNILDKENYTPLMRTCKAGWLEIVQLLLTAGANTNESRPLDAQNYPGYTALMFACISGSNHRLPMIKELIGSRANVNIKNAYGQTALMIACNNGHDDVAEYLLNHSANVDMQDDDGNTALHEACAMGYSSIVQLLLKHKAHVNIQNKKGKTPLWKACAGNYVNVVKILLDHHADVTLADDQGMTVLDVTEKKEIRDLLQAAKEKQTKQVAMQHNKGFGKAEKE